MKWSSLRHVILLVLYTTIRGSVDCENSVGSYKIKYRSIISCRTVIRSIPCHLSRHQIITHHIHSFEDSLSVDIFFTPWYERACLVLKLVIIFNMKSILYYIELKMILGKIPSSSSSYY